MRTRIETERLVLRLPRLDDADAWSVAIDDAEVMQYIGGSEGAASQSIERFLERWEANSIGQYAVERREDGALSGRIGLLVWDSRGHGDARLCRRQATRPRSSSAGRSSATTGGTATRPKRRAAVRDAAWAELGLQRLISLIHPDNMRSLRVAERLGAHFEQDIEIADIGPLEVWVHPR